VEILRAIDDALRAEQAKRTGKERMVAVHGNRFIAHQVFSQLDLSTLDDPDLNLGHLQTQARSLVPDAILSTVNGIAALFPTSYLQSLFKNASRCQALHAARAVAAPLADQPSPTTV
jgi:hypothetical protein